MDERVKLFRVGVTVLVGFIGTAILVLVFGQVPDFYKTYTIHIMLPEAPGVNEGTSVRKNGVLIGRVTGEPELIDGQGVRVTARINHDRHLYPEERVQILYSTLGDAKLEFVMPQGKKRSEKPVEEGYTFHGNASLEPVQMVADLQSSLRDMMYSVATTSVKMQSLADKADQLLDGNRERIERMINQADTTMRAVEKAMNSANTFLDDPELKADLKKTLHGAPDLVADAQTTMRHAQKSLDLLDTNLNNIQQFTKALNENGPVLLSKADATLQNVNELARNMADFSANLRNGQGTIGQLINNPELYNRLNSAVANVDEMVCEVRPLVRQIRPILDDARVFTDKIARHPESLGVRGALDRNPGIK
jgi:phospholipid/cholesterol/gamma-HCH transport system substrate-binding protein